MTWIRRAAAAAVMTVGSLAGSGVVQAAPPPNDLATGATTIAGLPFVDVVDTTEATTSQDELDLNEFCGAPLMEHGVWYTSTPTTSGFATIDTRGSDYSTGILVLDGAPGNFTPRGLPGREHLGGVHRRADEVLHGVRRRPHRGDVGHDAPRGARHRCAAGARA